MKDQIMYKAAILILIMIPVVWLFGLISILSK